MQECNYVMGFLNNANSSCIASNLNVQNNYTYYFNGNGFITMKILFISDLLAYGGASKLIYDLMQLLNDNANTCELLILTDKNSKYLDSLTELGIEVTVMPKSVSGHWARIKYIKTFIVDGEYDIIHANLFPVIYYVSFVKRFLGKKCPPIVMTEHSTDNKRRHKRHLRPLEKFVYKKYDHIISISDQADSQLRKWLSDEKDSSRYSVVENGIDVKRFKRAKGYLKEQLYSDYKNNDILMIMVGSFTPQKNHEKMIEALSKLDDRYKLLLIGEGPLLSQIQEKVKKMKLEKRVLFLGFRKDIPEVMHTVDLIVIPSKWEGFGLIAAEAMACGIPIVASDVMGLSDVVADCGLKCDCNDVNSIVQTIIKIQDVETQKRLVEKGIRRVEKYDIGRVASEYYEIYKAIVN